VHVVHAGPEKNGVRKSNLTHSRRHATTSRCDWLERRLNRQWMQVWRDNFYEEIEEVLDGLFVKETVNPYGVEGLSHRHRRTLPVSLFSLNFLLTFPMRRATCSVKLPPDRNPNCSPSSSRPPLISLRMLLSRMLSRRLSSGAIRKSQPGILPWLSTNITWSYFPAAGRYCVCRTALNIFMRSSVASGPYSVYYTGLEPYKLQDPRWSLGQ